MIEGTRLQKLFLEHVVFQNKMFLLFLTTQMDSAYFHVREYIIIAMQKKIPN